MQLLAHYTFVYGKNYALGYSPMPNDVWHGVPLLLAFLSAFSPWEPAKITINLALRIDMRFWNNNNKRFISGRSLSISAIENVCMKLFYTNVFCFRSSCCWRYSKTVDESHLPTSMRMQLLLNHKTEQLLNIQSI